MASTYEALPTTDIDGQEPDAAIAREKPPAERLGFFSRFRKRLIFFFLLCFVAFVFYKAGQWSVSVVTPIRKDGTAADKPEDLETNLDKGHNSTQIPEEQPQMAGKKYSVGYFVNWGIYGRKFPPSLIPAEDLTHILYAFADINPESGEVFLSDKWADQDIHYPGDSWNDKGTNLYGNFKAIYNLKKKHRHLKVLLSIGGWTYSPKFHNMIVSKSHRETFASSAIKLLEDYGLDGLDVDYEYPQNDAQADGYVELLKTMRHGLDKHAQEKGASYRFLLTIAAPCGPSNYEKLHIGKMDQYLDFWNMMAYDYSGSWDQISNHQANVYGGPIRTSTTLAYYESHGVPRSKMVLGIPLYGRSFLNTNGPGHSFSGVGAGSWEQGVYDYRALPLPHSQVHLDHAALASWTFDPTKKEMVSFDNEDVGAWKGGYIKHEGLGGGMFWELSGDKGSNREGMEGGQGKDPQPGRSLVKVVKEAMGELDDSPNWLHYERSKFDNMKAGMP
ncbi:Endochitinase 1 [Pleurotus pulmonarius]|nr:Endochitinase 1 [Pleurotus pulmonarius]KAF4599896.1 Endochitinase 1 [Pleurotus pulmonarius]